MAPARRCRAGAFRAFVLPVAVSTCPRLLRAKSKPSTALAVTIRARRGIDRPCRGELATHVSRVQLFGGNWNASLRELMSVEAQRRILSIRRPRGRTRPQLARQLCSSISRSCRSTSMRLGALMLMEHRQVGVFRRRHLRTAATGSVRATLYAPRTGPGVHDERPGSATA